MARPALRRQNANRLFDILIEGPWGMGQKDNIDKILTPEDYRIWVSTHVIPTIVELTPELKGRRCPQVQKAPFENPDNYKVKKL